MNQQVENPAPFTACRLDGMGGGCSISREDAAWQASTENPLWIHMDVTVADNAAWLMERSGLRPLVAETLIQAETRPRAVAHSDGLLVILRGVNLNPGADPEDMVSIRVWVEAGRVITTYRRNLLSIGDLYEQLDQGTGPKTPGRFLVMLADRLMDRAGFVINELEDAISGFEEGVLVDGEARTRSELSELRRQTVVLRRFFGPQRDAMTRLLQEQSPLLDDRDRLHLREVADQVMRYVEDLDAARERAAVAHEELLSLMSEQMNQRMYVLSIVAAVFLPLGFFTGLFGINVGGMPGVDSPLGFWLVTVMMVAIGIGVLMLFKWRRWF
ncbi:MAG: zinc transporter ZntB [Leptospirillia bacterium]